MTTLLVSASPGLLLWWSIWEGVTWSSLQLWSWHCSLGSLQSSSASSAWWHSSVDTVSLQYKSHEQYLQCVWLQVSVQFLENISLWEGVLVQEVNISLWEGVAVRKASFLLFHFGRVLRSCKQYFVLFLVYYWYYLSFRCDLFLLSDVPSCVRIL